MNYYGTVDGFFEYCDALGYDLGDLNPSPSPDLEVESILRRGSVYIDGMYRDRFSGKRTQGREQDREWPRTGATDASNTPLSSSEVPVEVTHATYEAALREHDSPGYLLPDYIAADRIKSETVGPLQTTYMDPITSMAGGADNWPVIGIIDQILAPLIGGSLASSALFGEVTR